MGKPELQPGYNYSSFNRKDYEPQVTPADLTDKINHNLETLLMQLQEGKTDRLLSYLTFSSRFHRYSARNQQLIFAQRPDATRVASYTDWKKEGYQVARGEKGIRILVPKFPKGLIRQALENDPSEEEDEEEQNAQKRKAREIRFITHHFTVGSVFDVKQLKIEDQRRIPKFFTPIEGDYEAIYERMREAVKSEGIKVVETYQYLQGAQALSSGGLILIRPDVPAGSKAHLLAHEWAHEYIHTPELQRKLPKTTKEGHAEAVAFVVSTHFGLPTPDSADYLSMWGNTPQSLRQELSVVGAASSHIIEAIHNLNPGEERLHDQI